MYRLPLWGIGNKLFTGPIVGIARGAVEIMEQHLQTQRNVGGLRLAEQPSVTSFSSSSKATAVLRSFALPIASI